MSIWRDTLVVTTTDFNYGFFSGLSTYALNFQQMVEGVNVDFESYFLLDFFVEGLFGTGLLSADVE